ncbi:hypothetical protein BDR07DRAFT_1419752 [Suillus spraguei]|nr:hypothetical protein BDR07DRAFT_1419752 [Suillus spraguei]
MVLGNQFQMHELDTATQLLLSLYRSFTAMHVVGRIKAEPARPTRTSFAAMVTLLEICRSKGVLSWFLRVVHLYVSCRFYPCSRSLLPVVEPCCRVNANDPSISSILHVSLPPFPALHSKPILSSFQATPLASG